MATVDATVLHRDAFLLVFVLPLEEASGRIAVVVMERKGSVSLNIIDEGLALSLARSTFALSLLAQKAYVDCVVICSAKQGNFLAGADIKFELRMKDYERAYADSAKLHHLMCALEALPVPTICVLNGAALGGGLELALACDYRIADATKCTQIGLPEVKLGVLPGAGGCVRLPRLIQLKNAVQMVTSGQAVNAKAARKLGLVDALFHETTTSAVFSQDKLDGLTLGWMGELKDCIRQRRIGDRMLTISSQVSVSGSPGVGESVVELTESIFELDRDATENLMNQTNWDACEKKFTMKYPPSFLRSNNLVQGIILSLALRGVRSSAGRCIPSPYVCLETIHKCLKANTLQHAVAATSEGFATLVTTPQSKCLMGLFLQTRAIKKNGETFGLKPSVEAQSRQGFEKEKSCVVLPPGDGEITGCFAQACIYSGIQVILIQPAVESDGAAEIEGITQEAHWRRAVEKQFQYAIKKGHWTTEKVSEAISNFVSCVTEEEFVSRLQTLPPTVYLVALGQCDCTLRLLSQSKEVQRTRNVMVITNEVSGVLPTATATFSSEGFGDCVYTSLFFPLTRTMRAVEVYGSQATRPESIRAVCSLFGVIGKLPILTNMSQMSVEQRLLVTFWAALAHLLCNTTRSPLDIDRAATRLAGFTKGPFETMKEIGIQSVDLLVATMTASSWLKSDEADVMNKALNQLSPSSRSHTRPEKQRKPASLSDEQVTLYLFLAAVEAALRVVAAPGLTVPHSTIDVLCVGGLMRFPPQEGGPLCYLFRNGVKNIGQKATELTQVLGDPVLKLLQPSTLSAMCDEMNLSARDKGMKERKSGVGEVQSLGDKEEFEWTELYSAGPCQPTAAFDAPQLPRVPWIGLLVIALAAILYLVVLLLELVLYS